MGKKTQEEESRRKTEHTEQEPQRSAKYKVIRKARRKHREGQEK